MGKYVYARSKAIVACGDATHRLYENEVWAADDPVVKANPALFSDEPVKIRRSPGAPVADHPVEAATAAPGEKRRTAKRG